MKAVCGSVQNICNYLHTTKIYWNAHSDSALSALILIMFYLHFPAVTMICDPVGVKGSMQFLNPDFPGKKKNDWLLPPSTDGIHYYLVWTI